MGYEPFRMSKPDELGLIAHRRAIAAVDWVDSLTELCDLSETEDKVVNPSKIPHNFHLFRSRW